MPLGVPGPASLSNCMCQALACRCADTRVISWSRVMGQGAGPLLSWLLWEMWGHCWEPCSVTCMLRPGVYWSSPKSCQLPTDKALRAAGVLITSEPATLEALEVWEAFCPDHLLSLSLQLSAWHMLGGLRDKCVIPTHKHIQPCPHPLSFLLSP